MKHTNLKSILFVVLLIAGTCAALAWSNQQTPPADPVPAPEPLIHQSGILTLGGQLVQNRILAGGDGRFSLALTLSAADTAAPTDSARQPVDMVIVLDRSGSMEGRKIHDAREAAIRLLDDLSPADRFALITYANGVRTESGLIPMTPENRAALHRQIRSIRPGGGTNLGAGLQTGISLLTPVRDAERLGRVILISDGLANQGVTDPYSLGRMAATAVNHAFAVSTVGVGTDFNEQLMTTLADRGAGSYYFLENPRAFARVFEREFQAVRRTAAADLKIRLPLKDGVRLVDAGGYPIKMESNAAVVNPGDLLAGQQRSFFLTFSVPTDAPKSFAVGNLEIHYQFHGENRALIQDHGLSVSCVDDPKAVAASVISDVWAKRVVQEEYSALKEAVADEIRNGKKHEALQKISAYESRNRDLNKSIGSPVVKQNLDQQVQQLIESVHETFSGPAAAVAEKKKQKAKEFQFEGYQMRRDKK